MLPFRIFKEATPAKELATWLQNRQVNATYHEAKPVMDTLYIGSVHTSDYIVSIAANDFEQARDLLVTYYQHQLKNIPTDYYLFDFSNNELKAILAQPDQWGDLDYALAQDILEQRGIAISEHQLQQMLDTRLAQLKQPEQAAKSIVYFGFILCFMGGFIGSLIGWHLAHAQKILPNGIRVPMYAASERSKGNVMIWIGIAITIVLTVGYFVYSYQ